MGVFLEDSSNNICMGGSHGLGSHRVTSQVPAGWATPQQQLRSWATLHHPHPLTPCQGGQQLLGPVGTNRGSLPLLGSRLGQLRSSCVWALTDSTWGLPAVPEVFSPRGFPLPHPSTARAPGFGKRCLRMFSPPQRSQLPPARRADLSDEP